jgi:two-component system cell cycle sensor histidine kinase/response regulator CckA
LLTFGRKAQLKLTHKAPNELVGATVTMLRRLVGDDVRLDVSLAPDLPAVSVDPVAIERALVNLVVNARDAMPDGGVVQVVTAETRIGEAPAVALSVVDEGPGIPEADLPNIFEPFFTTRGSAGGTGLGLATVLGTAEQHGGTVRVENREGRGSIFTLVLPAIAAQTAEEASRASARPEAAGGRGRRLLIIDDEPQVAAVTARLLERCGHSVQVATDPDAALSIWRRDGGELDLVICDVAMGATRGPELVARMAHVGPAPRVLFMTGYSEEASEAKLGHPVLAKPFSLPSLQAALEAALRDCVPAGPSRVPQRPSSP